jgi:hypothetical protein
MGASFATFFSRDRERNVTLQVHCNMPLLSARERLSIMMEAVAVAAAAAAASVQGSLHLTDLMLDNVTVNRYR